MLSETELPHLQSLVDATFPGAESELIESFRKLSENGKARAAAYVDFLVRQESDRKNRWPLFPQKSSLIIKPLSRLPRRGKLSASAYWRGLSLFFKPLAFPFGESGEHPRADRGLLKSPPSKPSSCLKKFSKLYFFGKKGNPCLLQGFPLGGGSLRSKVVRGVAHFWFSEYFWQKISKNQGAAAFSI